MLLLFPYLRATMPQVFAKLPIPLPLVALAQAAQGFGVIAALSLAAVGAVMAMAFNNTVAPVWVTSVALYGLPLAFLLMLALVIDAVASRRRTPGHGGR